MIMLIHPFDSDDPIHITFSPSILGVPLLPMVPSDCSLITVFLGSSVRSKGVKLNGLTIVSTFRSR